MAPSIRKSEALRKVMSITEKNCPDSREKVAGIKLPCNDELLALEKDCCLLILSCDSYSDLWEPFFALLRAHWPDCPFRVYLGSETKVWRDARVCTLLSKTKHSDWSTLLLEHLQYIKEKYVLLMLDDFFLRKRVSTLVILQCLSFAAGKNATSLCLVPFPVPTMKVQGSRLIGEHSVGRPYRLNTQGAIWRKEALAQLLRPGETIWQFEHLGNIRANDCPGGFFATRKDVLPYRGIFAHHVIQKGKWLPHEKLIFGRLNIGCDFKARSCLSLRDTMFYQFARLVDEALDILPWRMKKQFKKILRKAIGPFFAQRLARLGGRS